jgi:MerR family transcriptional regulator, thiopeptide resistance regulator
MARQRTYGTAAFAALAGVTPRALRYYDRLGLLRPGRSANGYRRYVEHDLQILQEIVALTFIGVPLKEIAGIRRRSKGPFALVLRAQREALEAKRRAVTVAIDAVRAAEALMHSGAGVDADALRRIIEVMHMEQQQEDVMATYTRMLKAKLQHLQAMSDSERAALRQEWGVLIDEVTGALGEDPAGPTAQRLLDRWSVLLARFTGASGAALEAAAASGLSILPPPTVREALWARRAEWMPQDASDAAPGVPADDAVLAARQRAESFVGPEVLEFIGRARAARTEIAPE